MAGAVEKMEANIGRSGETEVKRKRKGMSTEEVQREQERVGDLSIGRMLRCRVRYFTDGAVIGSKAFVNEAFASARERFGPKRKDGARKMRGSGSPAPIKWHRVQDHSVTSSQMFLFLIVPLANALADPSQNKAWHLPEG
jgi:hypothetical protein